MSWLGLLRRVLFVLFAGVLVAGCVAHAAPSRDPRRYDPFEHCEQVVAPQSHSEHENLGRPWWDSPQPGAPTHGGRCRGRRCPDAGSPCPTDPAPTRPTDYGYGYGTGGSLIRVQ